MNRIVLLVFMSTDLVASEKIKEMNRRQAGMCADAINNCGNYGQSVCSDPTYTDWVSKNCQAYCHKCTGASNGNHGVFTDSSTGMCADAINNCGNYGQSVCSDPTYTAWVSENCQAYCHKCTGASNGNHGVFTDSSTGCFYKDHVYQQGETWKDGCTYSCTCHDAATGKYACTGLCLKWNLPPSCSLNPPGPGKCCQTPNCPPNIQVQYPPGYVEQ